MVRGLRTTELVPLNSVVWVEFGRMGVGQRQGRKAFCVIASCWVGSTGDSLECQGPGVWGEEKVLGLLSGTFSAAET